jgi:hypothetical protein
LMSNGFITAGWSGHSFTLVAPINSVQQAVSREP